MRNFTKLTRSIYIGFITLLFSLAWTNVYAGIVSINPDITRVELNDVFTVNIDASEFSSPVDGWGLDVSWDTSKLALESSNVNTTLWNLFNSTGDASSAGSLLNMGGSQFGEVSGAFNLASLSFRAIASGSTDIMLAITDDTSDAFRWGNLGVSLLPENTFNGRVEISSVPLPAGLWLMMTGLTTLLIGVRRK